MEERSALHEFSNKHILMKRVKTLQKSYRRKSVAKMEK